MAADKENKSKNILWLLAVEFAVLMSVPFLVPHTGMLAVVAFVPLFAMERLITENGIKHAFVYYYTAFVLFNIGATYWIWNVSPVGAVAAIALNALQMAAVFALYRWSSKVLVRWSVNRGKSVSEARICALVFFAVTWLAWEHIYFDVEFSWPWLCLGNAFATSTELVQWYETTGALGGSLWILICNILIFIALCNSGRKRRNMALAFVAVALVPMVISLARYHSYHESDNPFEVVAVQPNIDPFSKYGVIPQEQLDDRLIALAEEEMTENTLFVVTPETFTYGINVDRPQIDESIIKYQDFLGRHSGANMLLGALTYRYYNSPIKPTGSARRMSDGIWYDSFNTALTLDSENVFGSYFKSRLVPGVERIPYGNVLKPLGWLIEACGGSSSSYGTQDKMEALASNSGQKVGAMICYESIYGDFSRNAVLEGATLMAVMTNDGWWGDTPGYRQHFRFARLRAIEFRRDVLQVANTGTSGIINQRGDVLISTPWWVEVAFRGTMNGNGELTFFARHGDCIGRCSCFVFIGLLILSLLFSASDRRFSRGKSAKGKI